MTTGEDAINTSLAEVLDAMRQDWKVSGQPKGKPLKSRCQPDILIKEYGMSPVIIETEIYPARTVDEDAIQKLGQKERTMGQTISSVIAVRIPIDYSKHDGETLRNNLRAAIDLEYAVYTQQHDRFSRFPKDGWLVGGAADIAVAAQTGMISSEMIDTGADILECAINNVTEILSGLDSPIHKHISHLLKQPPVAQTWQMASFVLLNAVVFHDRVATPNNIPTKNELMGLRKADSVNVEELLKSWKRILVIDYYPIFHTARCILEKLGDDVPSIIMARFFEAAGKINQLGLERSSDLYGEVFQRTIPDQKKLAAFYTRPESAALLTTLTMPATDDHVWKDPDSMKKIRVADFACGTGSLLLAAYRTMVSRYEAMSGESMADIHDVMMGKCMIGADVLPVAAHLTASALAGMYPKRDFFNTRISVVEQGGKENKIGSLEWIRPELMTLDESFSVMTSDGEEGRNRVPEHGSCDVILMNPPFARSKGPGGQDVDGNYSHMFEAFDSSDADRKKMSARASKLFKGLGTDKKAGFATFFAVLADAKIREGGMIGLVLPMTAATGESWKKFRGMIVTKYTNAVIINFNGPSHKQMAVSGDTGMGEIMIAVKRRGADENHEARARFVSLNKRPASILESIEIGRSIVKTKVNRVESGPRGGTPIKIGNDVVGNALGCPFVDQWDAIGVVDYSLPQITYQLRRGLLCLPHNQEAIMKITTLNEIAKIGPSHLQIRAGNGSSTSYSGPFDIFPHNTTCIYPTLWNNNSKTQKCMIVEPDTMAIPRHDKSDQMIAGVAETASHVHASTDLRTTSQHLMFSYTREKTIGGRGWPSICIPEKYEKALMVWGNSTLGFLSLWSIANRQHYGRSIVPRTTLRSMPVPDFSKISNKVLTRFGKAFDQFEFKPLDCVMNLWKDPVRIELDDTVLKIMEIDVDLGDLRKRLCNEPSVNGGKDSIV